MDAAEVSRGTHPPRAAKRLDGLSSTIFTEMASIAARTKAINLGQGFPDEDGPSAVIEAAVHALRNGRNQYPPGHGVRTLIDAVRRQRKTRYDLDLERENVVITTGATEALAGAMLGLVNPGDEVVVLEPYFDSYPAMITFAGGVRRSVTLEPPDYRLDLAALERAITPRTKLLLLNSPHNPTGMVLTRDELAGIAAVALRHDLIVVTDEVYEYLTYDDHQHVPLATLPGMAERTLAISSIGKSYSLTGWKVGWATGPADLVAAVEGAKNWLTYASGAPLQPAAAVALNEHPDFPDALASELAAKRDHLCAGLAAAGLTVYRPSGTYFVTTDVSAAGFSDGRAFCHHLAQTVGVVAIPTQTFYDDPEVGRHLVRWAFCKKYDVLDAAIERLRSL